MNYLEISFKLNPFRPYHEILVAQLSELGFESFMEDEKESSLKAYISEDEFVQQHLDRLLDKYTNQLKVDYQIISIQKENWNKKWEGTFKPIEISSFCRIRAPFHSVSSKPFKFELCIEPKMSFGTGHHATTQLMIQLLEKQNLSGKMVLDMGSGTGILAILADKMQAKQVDAVDVEQWAFENVQENVLRNQSQNVKPQLGDANLLKNSSYQYDIIMANINKNTLLRDLSLYSSVLHFGGSLLLSGFFTSDREDILDCQELINFSLLDELKRDGWLALHLIKVG